jgi:thiamine-monophosphate kinase
VGSLDPAEALRRDGAGPGWQLAVTGMVGAAAAALRVAVSGEEADPAWRRAARPIPRVEAGQALLAAGVRVAIDVSDGLYADAARLLTPGGPGGLVIDAGSIPAAPGIRRRWPREWQVVVGGGEDYELLFGAGLREMARARAALAELDLDVTVIGTFDRGPGLRLLVDGAEGPPPASGHVHFAG